MATVSTRIDDHVKSNADQIANEIGIPLRTAINIFLKRFVANKGFPFSVVAPVRAQVEPVVNVELLDASVKKAIADPNNVGLSHQFTYLDPDTKQIVNVNRKE